MHHSMLPLIISCTRPWNFAWHLLCHSTTESKNIVKLSGNEPNHSHRVLQGRLFSKGKISIYLRVCFTQCTLFFHKVCFLLPICMPCIICGSSVTKTNDVWWHSARQTFVSLGLYTFACIECLLQLWIKTSEPDYPIWRPNNYTCTRGRTEKCTS